MGDVGFALIRPFVLFDLLDAADFVGQAWSLKPYGGEAGGGKLIDQLYPLAVPSMSVR